ncbi:helix-turn-helix protein [bacterium BMS3Abin04]|nr:helix-turn-helix protein [bacterium BMS3Abin04]
MKLTQSNIKLIFGLKVKQLRQSKNLSLSQLAKKAKMSISYLNEIESGKKYPKTDKISALSKALGINYDNLVSLKLNKQLAPIGELLDSNVLDQLPLDHYGIDVNKLIALLANAPLKLNVLVSTIIEMAKRSEMSQNNFSRTALRMYKEFNENYFPDLELAVDKFRKKYKLSQSKRITFNVLSKILKENFNYLVDDTALNHFPELRHLRAVVSTDEKPRIYLNNNLSDYQKSFILGKELAYNYLNISDRSYIYSAVSLDSFDQLLNNLNTSYFSTSLMIPGKKIINDFAKFLKRKKWDGEFLLLLLKKYNVSPEMLFQRIASIAPKYFQLNKFFFFRFEYDLLTKNFNLTKELRLNINQNPGGYHYGEHYCRRWISLDIIKKLDSMKKRDFNQHTIGAQISNFIYSTNQFLSISIAKINQFNRSSYSSVTLGFKIDDDDVKNKIKFLQDLSIKIKEVNNTCERCDLPNCKERVIEPIMIYEELSKEKIQKAINKLLIES